MKFYDFLDFNYVGKGVRHTSSKKIYQKSEKKNVCRAFENYIIII